MSVNEEAVVSDHNMDEPDKDESLGPPTRTKKKKMKKIQPLKRKATGPIGGIGARKINMSLNSSVVKQTLRSNNRSLARALEMARQEYSVLQQQFVELQTHQLNFERRAKKRLGDLHSILDTVSLKLSNSVSLLAEAQSLCSIDECMDATIFNNTVLEETPVQPRPMAKRILSSSTNPSAVSNETPDPLDNVNRRQSDVPSDESPTTDPEAVAQAEEVTNEIIETMRQDLSHVVTSLQGCKAPPVSLPPLDVSVVMEQSYFIDQVPLMFADEDGEETQKDVSERRRGHSRSRSGRRSAMLYKTSVLDSDLSDAPLPAARTSSSGEEKGPRRSLRARSKSRLSRQEGRKTIGEDVLEEPHSEDPTEQDCVSTGENISTESPKSAPIEPQNNQEVVEPCMQKSSSVPQIIVEDHGSEDKGTTDKVSDSDAASGTGSESHGFKPKREIPRTPPSRRASATVDGEEAEPEVQPEPVGIEMPRFISLEPDNSTKFKKANKKRLSTKNSKKIVKPSVRTSLDNVQAIKKVDSEKVEVAVGKPTEPEDVEASTTTEIQVSPVQDQDDDATIIIDKAEILASMKSPENVDEPTKSASPEKVQEPARPESPEKVEESTKPEKVEESTKPESPEEVKVNERQLGKRRSHLRRGTFNLANKAPLNYAEDDEEEESSAKKPVALSEEVPPKRSQRQRRGTYCLPEQKPEPIEVPAEQNKKDLRQKRGTFFIAEESEAEELPAENQAPTEIEMDDQLAADLEDEHEITLVGGVDSDDNCPTEEDIPTTPTNVNAFGSETICIEEDMEMTEVLNIPLHMDKIPLPSFIKEGLKKAEAEDSTKANEKEGKSSSHKKLVPKLKKKKREEKNDTVDSSVEDQLDSKRGKKKAEGDSKEKEVKSLEKESSREIDDFKKPNLKMLKPLAKLKARAAKAAKAVQDKVSESESSDSDKERAKFQAVLERPGKIVFKAGRKNAEEIKSQVQKFVQGKPRSKVKSLLPRPGKPRSKTARSKTRLLSLDSEMKLGFEAKKPKDPALNSVFDMSLNESITVLPQMSYGDFREQNPAMEAMKAALKTGQNEESTSDASPHGIMLVMGNGKRTKPRERSKSVTYARKLAKVHLRTPSTSSCSDSSPTRRAKVFAGNTPPRPKAQTPEEPQEEDILVPDTPEFRFLKKSKRPIKDISDKVSTKKSVDKLTEKLENKDNLDKVSNKKLVEKSTDEIDITEKIPNKKSVAKSSLSVDSVSESLSCSTYSRQSSTNDSVFEKPSHQPDDQPEENTEVKESKPKKRQSQVKQTPTGSEKKRKQKAQESVPDSTEKGSAKSKRAEQGSVGKKARESTDSKRSSSTKRSLNLHDEFKVPADVEMEPKRSRRAASQVSYKEPSLNCKLRRGDPTSATLYKEGEHDLDTKRRKSEKRSRSVLTTITNTHDKQ